MKKIKRIFSLAAVFILLTLSIANRVSAESKDESYLYNIWQTAVPAPEAYELERSVRAQDLKVDSLESMSDIFYRNGKIYITMAGKIVITDPEFQSAEIISTYNRGTEPSQVNAPTGIFVTKDDHIYIAEQDAGEIVEFDQNHNFVRALTTPDITGLSVKYAPSKVVVDDVGRIYVKAQSIYEGIIELNPEGEFNRFVGANEVMPSIVERFYRLISTEEQQKRMKLWLPTDYSDIAIDSDGFIFATVNDSSASEPLRKLNSKGDDVMPEIDFVPRPMGDFNLQSSLSLLTSVCSAEDGRFAALDANNSRVFVYSEDGYMMYVVGGNGKTKGSLNSPMDLTFMDDKLLVIDLVSQTIEVYKETEYGALINQGLKSQHDYDYATAFEQWDVILKINPNFYYANLGIAKYQLRSGEYAKAMENFQKSGVRNYYSIAFEYVRDLWLNNNFGIIVGVIVLLIVLVIAKKIYRHYRPKKEHNGAVFRFFRKLKFELVTFPMRVLTTPFKAFDDVKTYNEGSIGMCIFVAILYAWSRLMYVQNTGFLVLFVNNEELSVAMVMASAILPFLIFIIGNWAVGVLISGKGAMKDITKVIFYSLYPCAILNLVGTVLSNVVSEEEAALVVGLLTFANIMFAFYAFIGLIMVNQYTFTKNVGSIVLSFIAMLIIIFLALLLVTLLSGFITDIVTIFTELKSHF